MSFILACGLFFITPSLPAFATPSHEFGKMSWYGGTLHNQKTASGSTFNKNAYSAAHKQLPFGTVVRVYSLHNNKHVLVEVTDRGPFTKGRIIDVSKQAAKALGLIQKGVGKAAIEVVSKNDGTPLNPDNAFYISLTKPMSPEKAQKVLPELQKDLQGKPLKVLYSNQPNKQTALIGIGPYTTFRKAKKTHTTLPEELAGATIIEARKDGNTFVKRTPPLPKKTKKNSAKTKPSQKLGQSKSRAAAKTPATPTVKRKAVISAYSPQKDKQRLP